MVFILIFKKLLALFCLIALGFVTRRWLQVDRDSIAKLIFYVLVPIVFFDAAAKSPPNVTLFNLPIIIAVISGIAAFIALYSSKYFLEVSYRSIFAFASANANVGYLLLPIVWEMFDSQAASVFVIMVLGNVIYENTIGFFIASSGNFSAKESINNIIRLPALHALLLGIIFSFVEKLSIPEMFHDVILNVRGAYSVLGMMIIGFAIADIKHLKLDWKFISSCLVIKFLVWPLLALITVEIDKHFIHAYDTTTHKMLILFSTAPLAANNVVIASLLKLHPDTVASSVVISTIFALFYIPIVISVFSLI